MSGFLIEVRPGRELLYRTTWALREAMRSGEVNPDSRIFHRATSQWISITEHPEYRRFLTDHAQPAWLALGEAERAEQEAEAETEPAANGRRIGHLFHRLAEGWIGLVRRLESAFPDPEEAPADRPPKLQRSRPEEPPTPPPAPAPPPEPPQTPRSSATRDRWTYFP